MGIVSMVLRSGSATCACERSHQHRPVMTASLNKREAVDPMMFAFTEARFNPVARPAHPIPRDTTEWYRAPLTPFLLGPPDRREPVSFSGRLFILKSGKRARGGPTPPRAMGRGRTDPGLSLSP